MTSCGVNPQIDLQGSMELQACLEHISPKWSLQWWKELGDRKEIGAVQQEVTRKGDRTSPLALFRLDCSRVTTLSRTLVWGRWNLLAASGKRHCMDTLSLEVCLIFPGFNRVCSLAFPVLLLDPMPSWPVISCAVAWSRCLS